MSLPLTKDVLERLAIARVAEAEHLLAGGYFSGAYYLGGYALELALKACIADSFQPKVIPEKRLIERIYTHDLLKLVDVAGLEADRIEKIKRDAIFAQHWEAASQWSETARYDIVDEPTARGLLDALRESEHGVFGWIRSHW